MLQSLWKFCELQWQRPNLVPVADDQICNCLEFRLQLAQSRHCLCEWLRIRAPGASGWASGHVAICVSTQELVTFSGGQGISYRYE